MTALLHEDYREPPDCDYHWITDPTADRRCSVHVCIIQWGHSHPCVCRCGRATWKPRANLPARWRWTGLLDDTHDGSDTVS